MNFTNKTEYLYGSYSPEPIPKEIAKKRIEALDKHIAELIEVDFWKRDCKRLNDVLKAKEFWEKFLKGEYE